MNNLPNWLIYLMADPVQAASILVMVVFIIFIACFWRSEP